MSDRQALCSGHLYRGTIVLTVQTEQARRCVVIGAPYGAQVQLYECATLAEAQALVDAALLMIGADFTGRCVCFENLGDNDRCPLHSPLAQGAGGGPRLVGFESPSMTAV